MCKIKILVWALALILSGIFAVAPWPAEAFRNWGEFAAACRASGGNPVPNPPRCYPGGGSSGPSQQEIEQQRQRQNEVSLHDANDRGVQCFNQQNWACAIESFTDALRIEPDDGVILNNLRRAEAAQADALRRAEAERQAQAEMIARANMQRAENEQLAALARSIRSIRVPPPILPEEAVISFGQLPHSNPAPIYAGDALVALELTGKIAGVALPASKLIMIAGNSFIAAENAADVYLVRQEALYQKALNYLKDAQSREAFTRIVRALKEGRPIPEDASIDMARAAQAIIDPKLGNSSLRRTWDALLSPEAQNAWLTQISIELGAEVLGLGGGAVLKRLNAARYLMFQEATKFLPKARDALRRSNDPEVQRVLKDAIGYANLVVKNAYETSGHHGLAAVLNRYSTRELDHIATQSFDAQQIQSR